MTRTLPKLAACVVFAIMALSASLSRSDDYPLRPIHLVVGFPPGASMDITARMLGNGLSQILGQQIVVENKPGAGSSIAAEYAAHAANDGYTLYVGSSANITNQAINPNLSFDMIRDFAPIARSSATSTASLPAGRMSRARPG
jgi:tripartite-type tricarboxylate transporter receptor subunit TctC